MSRSCPAGHEISGGNAEPNPNGLDRCRTCRREQRQRSDLKRRSSGISLSTKAGDGRSLRRKVSLGLYEDFLYLKATDGGQNKDLAVRLEVSRGTLYRTISLFGPTKGD